MSEEEQFKKRPHGDIESNEEMINRLIPFLREVSVAYPGKNILIATHGGIIRTFMIHLGWATDKNLPAGSIENTAYAKIDCDGIDFIVKETSGFAKKPLG